MAGSKTASGNPILCNDPHLSLTLPSVWFEIQIHTPDMNAYGVSLPGLPGIVIGFNEDIAWGQTNVGQDVTDWYNIQWTNDEKTLYLLDGEAVPVTWQIEEIKTKSGPTIIDSVKYTYWGPVVAGTDDPYQDMALQWLAHTQNDADEMRTFLGLTSAKNYDDYSEALSKYISPAQNFVFASREGDIALKVNGRFPIKRESQGRFVQDGSLTSNGWQGFIPMDQVPQIKNPERGFVASANQHSTAPDYPYPYIGGFGDYRGRILNRKLDAMEDITIQDMMDLQNDVYSLKAEEALPLLLKGLEGLTLNDEDKTIFNALKSWDYNYKKSSAQPIYFDMWFRQFYKLTWDEIYTLKDDRPMLFPESWRTIALLEEDPVNKYFDIDSTTKVEIARDIAQQSFKWVVTKIEERKKDNKSLRWDQYNKAMIGHIGRIPAFASEIMSIGGCADVLNAVRGSFGPSWRMVVELGDEVEAYGVYPGGQSGNPGSPYYNNMLEDWAAGNYNKLQFVKTPTELENTAVLTQIFQ